MKIIVDADDKYDIHFYKYGLQMSIDINGYIEKYINVSSPKDLFEIQNSLPRGKDIDLLTFDGENIISIDDNE